jgi:NAD-dependent dihydropyrimidine dehydrogenase PreA subunit
MLREIVSINEELCDGCGECVPACREGALRIVDGKARLVSDRLCDGLGACLGHCPRGAIRIERREVAAFDAAAVAPQRVVQQPGGCPGSLFARFEREAPSAPAATGSALQLSQLTHWPVQLHLLSPVAPVLRGARLLVAADCVPVAYGNFHADFLRGRAIVIACPKLDDTRGYVEKLTTIIAQCGLQEITVVHMEVPCCTGILHAVLQARAAARSDLPVDEVVISTRGQVVARRRVGLEDNTARVGGMSSVSKGVRS